MPVILKLTFPAGQYHATPWGRHVNEGVPEWPPSPWRLLRALVATWKRKCPRWSEEEVRRVLARLAGPPNFSLPPARVAHTRHYMPWEKKGPADRTLVFDTYVAVRRCDPLFAGWPDVTLSDDERSTLQDLLKNLSTFGRAEGWVEAELANGASVAWNCVPAAASDGELVPVMCADPATAFGSEYYPQIDPRKLKKGLPAGDHLFDCPRWHLCLDTEVLHEKRWPRVPGAMWVSYARPADAFTAVAPKNGLVVRAGPTVARFSLDAPVLPLVTQTVVVAEAFRTGLLRSYQAVVRRRLGLPREATRKTHAQLRSRTLSGKEGSRMVRGSHDHAYYLPADEDGDGRIDHVSVVAAGGLSADEVAALDRQRRLPLGEAELRMLLVGLGHQEDFRCPLFGPARVWESATPFVVTRHVKSRGQKKDPPECHGPEGRKPFAVRVLREELVRLRSRCPDVPSAADVGIDLLERIGRGVVFRPLEFHRSRDRHGADGMQRATIGVRLTFPHEVCGPLCLGYAAHFGLGLFLAKERAPSTREIR